jgi:hypothetical protein
MCKRPLNRSLRKVELRPNERFEEVKVTRGDRSPSSYITALVDSKDE